MPTLPTVDTLGRRDTPTPQRSIRGYRPQSVTANMEGFGNAVEIVQKKIDENTALDVQNRTNNAKREVLSMLYGSKNEDGTFKDGLYSAKGANAMDTENKYATGFTGIRERALAGLKDPNGQSALSAALDDLDVSNLGNVKRFVADERTGYKKELGTSALANSRDQVGLEWNNDKTFTKSMATTRKLALAQAKQDGLSADGQSVAVRGAVSGLYDSRLRSMVDSGDPANILRAKKLYDDARVSGDLNLDTVTSLDTLFEQALPKAEAYDAFNKFQTQDQIGNASTRDIFSGMVQVESTGNHNAPDGSILTSSAGAKGVAQLMPDTARMMEGELGLPRDSYLDKATNLTIGEAYLNKMQTQFQNNTLAVLAYNWGPGNVQKHIDKVGDPRTGAIAMDQFIASVDSAEARAYVPKVMGAMGVGGASLVNVQSAEAVASTLRPEAQKEFTDLVTRHNDAIQGQRTAKTKDIMSRSMPYFAATGGGVDAMPSTLRAEAAAAGIWDQLSTYNGKTNPETANYLYGLSAKELQDTDLDTPGVRLNLSQADYQKWTKKQQALDNGAVQVTHEARNSIVSKAFVRRNMSTQTNKGKQQVTRLNDLLDLEIDAFSQQNNGRMPNSGELQGIVDDLFAMSAEGKATERFAGYGKTHIFDVDVNKIPKDRREKVIRKLESRGVPATDAAIVEAYVSGLDG